MSNLYKSKPSEVEALQWTNINIAEIRVFAPARWRISNPTKLTLELLAGQNGAQGWVPVPVGHWIVHNLGDDTHYWPVDPDYFSNKYEKVESP